MISGSAHLLQIFPLSTLKEMRMLMYQACSLDPMEIRKYEELRHDFCWQSFLDCVHYLYVPLTPQMAKLRAHSMEIEELCLLSTDALLHYLESALGRSEYAEIIVSENLLDFIIALPWIVPRCYEERATHVVKELAKFRAIQPLPLLSIAKAKLAKSIWGLKKLMEVSSLCEL